MSTDDIVKVTAAEFHRNIDAYQDMALTKVVTITKNGRDRKVIAAGDLSERHVAALRAAKVPDQYADLDRELQGNMP